MIINIGLTIISLLCCLIVGEWWAPDFENERYRDEWELVNQRVNARNKTRAMRHPYGFNDTIRDVVKPDNQFRVAVLGDSFIWGDGVDYDTIWSHKLERLCLDYNPNIEVMSWGLMGWSTLDEYNFLIKEGISFNPDLLILGWVDNDLDFRDNPQIDMVFPGQPWLKKLGYIFPDLTGYLADKIPFFLSEHVFLSIGYVNWLKSLYEPENLKNYEDLLLRIVSVCKTEEIDFLLVFSPTNYTSFSYYGFKRLEPILIKHGIPYVNLFPVVKNELGHISHYKLRANPVNWHPGPELTRVFSQTVFDYLKRQRLIPIP